MNGLKLAMRALVKTHGDRDPLLGARHWGQLSVVAGCAGDPAHPVQVRANELEHLPFCAGLNSDRLRTIFSKLIL